MSTIETFHIKESTEKGLALLNENDSLRRILQALVDSPQPENTRVQGLRFLGAGRYSFTYAAAGIVLKVSSPTSSQDAFDQKRPLQPENLPRQFEVMGALHNYLRQSNSNIVAPEQYFVSHTPHNAYVLGQEYMAGWQPIGNRHEAEQAKSDTSPEVFNETTRPIRHEIRRRLQTTLADFALLELLNDLRLDKDKGLHGGNLLIPISATFDGAAPLCIIDQPGGLATQEA